MSHSEAVHLSNAAKIADGLAKVRVNDPGDNAAIMAHFQEHKDELCHLVLFWLMEFGDSNKEYQRLVSLRKRELIAGGLKPTPAETQAEAECIEAKLELEDSRHVHQYYKQLLKRLENKNYD